MADFTSASDHQRIYQQLTSGVSPLTASLVELLNKVQSGRAPYSEMQIRHFKRTASNTAHVSPA